MNFFNKKKNTQHERIFLDYASTTPMDIEALEEMKPYLHQNFYNPSSLYKEGVAVKKIIDNARGEIAKLLHVRAGDIYFTASGTESDNLALLGIFQNYKTTDFVPHFIVSKIEHPGILEVAKKIEEWGGEVTYINVNKEGLINLEEVTDALKENTVLVSVMYANNEIGTVEPLAKIARIINKFKSNLGRDVKDFPYLHSDASQAPNYLDCNCEKLGVDMMTLDGSKIYGPKGIGMLYKKHYVSLKPTTYGGGQESGLRSGTENVPAIIGFTKAFLKVADLRESESARLSEIRDYFIEKVLEKFPNANLNGSAEFRLPNNINICFPGINAEFEVIRLDEKGIACAYTTACKTLGDESKSYVIEALGKNDCATSSLRFTLGRDTTKEEVDLTVDRILF